MSLYVYLKEDVCSACGRGEVVWSGNYTHNVAEMADEAGIYGIVWRPHEHGVILARDIIDRLRAGIKVMKADPEKFKAFNPSNGWGSYDRFVQWLEDYLDACIKNPNSYITSSR